MSYFVLALHGHLPFIHHPEHEHFLEEDWFFEAVADCYLPILSMLDGWRADGVRASITMGLSPPLLAMMGTRGLRERMHRYLDARRVLCDRYLGTIGHDHPYRRAAEFARQEAEHAEGRYDGIGGDLARAFAEHHQAGRVEVMTCAATHGLAPVLQDAHVIRAQVKEAVKAHERALGLRPRGIWLPECGIHPEALAALAEEDLCFTFSEDRAVRFAWPPPQHDVYRPIWSPEGVAVFPRDPGSAKEVWSAEEGYPGDFRYREFYRDLGYDAPEALKDAAHKQGTGAAKNVGAKLHRITGRVALDEKQPYDPEAAQAAARAHAQHFAERRTEDAADLAMALAITPCITAAFDAELFGHWWFEGPIWLERVLELAAPGTAVEATTPDRELSSHPLLRRAFFAEGSWGASGDHSVWVNPQTEWFWRELGELERHAFAAVRWGGPRKWRRAILNQLLLAAASDWPFLVTMGTGGDYAEERFRQHCARLRELIDLGPRTRTLPAWVEGDMPFPDLEPEWARAPEE